MYRWGIPVHAQMENMTIHTPHVQRWWKISASGRFYYYNEGTMRIVHEEVNRGSSRLL